MSKFSLIARLQHWMDSVPGQTFMNYAYSWGASIVILGALFKLTHMPGANFWLFLGMGTEVLVFFISGFDRPFDKTADGRELPTHVGMQTGVVVNGEDGFTEGEAGKEQIEDAAGMGTAAAYGGGGVVGGGGIIGGGGVVGGGGGTIIIGGGGAGSGEGTAESGEHIAFAEGVGAGTGAAGGTVVAGAGGNWVAQQQEKTPDMAEAQGNYVEQLTKLTEMLGKVSEQSERLTRDSEEMENLNRTLTGICKVYEMQLKGASQQIGTIDEINEQSRKMAQQIAELNKIYTRMIEAMTVNMPKGAMPPVSGEQ